MPAGLRFFGPERGSEAIDFAERRRRGLDVQLPRLREVGRAQVEVFGGEQVARRLADRTGENRRIDQDEMPLIEKVTNRLDHLVAHARDRHLTAAAEPQVAVLEQERRAVLLGSDRESDARPDDLQVGRRELDAARRARIGAHRAADLHRRLLSEPAERLPCRFGHVLLRQHDLEIPGAVPQRDEPDLPRRARSHDPASGEHGLADERRKVFDAVEGRHGGGRLVAVRGAVNAS